MLRNGCSNFKVNLEVKSVCHVLLFFYVKTQEAQNEVAATNVRQNLNDDDHDEKIFQTTANCDRKMLVSLAQH